MNYASKQEAEIREEFEDACLSLLLVSIGDVVESMLDFTKEVGVPPKTAKAIGATNP